jgi:hypothetical protein
MAYLKGSCFAAGQGDRIRAEVGDLGVINDANALFFGEGLHDFRSAFLTPFTPRCPM